jgi:hypothetical protein
MGNKLTKNAERKAKDKTVIVDVDICKICIIKIVGIPD